ncbi:MAG: membrane dipeptidase [Calditrichaeota bacterium]|nr:membrane dipeptidase [Calditrichota bacterium]
MPDLSQIPVCDMHCDTAFEILAGKSLATEDCQVNLPAMKRANVKIQVFACYISPMTSKGARFPMLMNMIAAFKKEIEKYPEEITLCTDSSQIESAMASGKIAAILAVENGMAVENNVYNLQTIYEAGVRLMTIVHSVSSDWAISSNDKNPAFDGLTENGAKMIAQMNRLGMIVDVSHAHEKTVTQVLQISEKPIVASHSCAATICPVPRNLTDDQIRQIATRGGMVGVNFFPGFLDHEYWQTLLENCGDLFEKLDEMEVQAQGDAKKISDAFQEYREEFRREMAGKNVTLNAVIDHVEHIRALVGDDAVGFGSDFDGVPALPEGINSVADFHTLRERMVERGISGETLEKISYKNFLRVFRTAVG